MLKNIPDFCFSHWLLRLPLIVIFLQQGLAKLPIDADTADSWGLPLFVWIFVVIGEIGGAIGLAVGGLLYKYFKVLGDMITRFSGVTVCCIVTGVIWIAQPESFLDVILYDNLHVMLWVGGMFFALRGNNI